MFFGDVCYIDEKGNELERPRTVALKMEVMLETVLEQRRLHIERLVQKKDPRVSSSSSAEQHALTSLKFTETDMKELMNAWRLNVSTWMKSDTQAVYWKARNRQAMGKNISALIYTTSAAANSCCAASSLCQSFRLQAVLHSLQKTHHKVSSWCRAFTNSPENGRNISNRPSTWKR